MKKRVFILINTLGTGGAERVVSLLIHNWKNRYDLTLVLLTDLIEYELPVDLKVIHLKQPFRENGLKTFLKLPLLARRYRKLCREGKADVSISFLKRPNYISCLSKWMGNSAQIIVSERSYFSELLKTLPPPQWQLSAWLTKRLYPLADQIVTNSELMRRDLVNAFKIPGEYHVIPNPINTEYVQKMSAAEDGFSRDGRFTFIHVGAFRKEKNQRGLIEAFRLLNRRNARLLLLGHRYLRDDLMALVKQMDLESQITFLDFDTNPFKYLSKSDCFVLPSDFEGFPNSLLEAMACGLPVISTDCKSGPREILAPDTDPAKMLTDGYEVVEYGILTPVGDIKAMATAMERVVADGQLRADMKQKSLRRARDFESGKIIDRFSALVDH